MPGGENTDSAGQGSGTENYECPSCGEKAEHKVGVPCYGRDCPRCGRKMTKER